MRKGFDYIGVNVVFFCHDGEGNFLLHKRSVNCRDEQGCWDFGGGALEFGLTFEENVRKEVFEEYKATILDIEYVGPGEYVREQEGKLTHWVGALYKVLVERDSVEIGEPDKCDEIGWFSLDELPEPLHSQIVPTLKKMKHLLVN